MVAAKIFVAKLLAGGCYDTAGARPTRMIRELFHIGPYSQSPFGLLMVLAFVAAFLQLRANFKRLDIGSEDDPHILLFWAALSGFVGGKIYYSILHQDWRVLYQRYGLVWYGGFLVAATVVLLVARRRRLPVLRTADAAAPALALGYAVGRVGCFLVGDDYGVPTSLPWGVQFPVGLPPTDAGSLRSHFGISIPTDVASDEILAVHPTQLYETGLGLGVWAVGMWALRRFKRPGSVAMLVLALMVTERFFVETLRAKDDRFLGSFTVAQLISVLLLVAVAALVTIAARRAPPAAPTLDG